MAALLVAFRVSPPREAVGQFRNLLMYVRTDEIPSLGEGEYYHHELIGMQVVDEGGRYLA